MFSIFIKHKSYYKRYIKFPKYTDAQNIAKTFKNDTVYCAVTTQESFP